MVSITSIDFREAKAEIIFGVNRVSIMFESGLSMSSSPLKDDFVKLVNTKTKNQLNIIAKALIITVEVIIQYTVTADGLKVISIRSKAYYIPDLQL